MIAHNFKAGWRNLLKYKTQNIISILCLSVGVVCLCVCVYVIRMIKVSSPEMFDEHHATLYIGPKDESIDCRIRYYSELQKELKEQVSGVEDIYYLYRRGEDKLDVKMLDGKELTINGPCSYLVSNNYLEHRDWTSAITGKPIKHIKQGGAIIESYTRDRYFGEGVNPIGCIISNGTVTARIEDVIDMGRMASKNEVYFADDNVEEIPIGYSSLQLDCIIKDDVTHQELQEEFVKKCPNYSVHIGFSDSDTDWLLAVGLILFLGSCVLIVGMSGYLKMQMQLFMLRSREIALRRCNGARPSQLFVLLCCEILIVFVISGVLSALLLKLVSDFVMNMFAKFTFEVICFNFGYLYLDCLTICVVAFLVAVIIAWFSVWKVLTAPLLHVV